MNIAVSARFPYRISIPYVAVAVVSIIIVIKYIDWTLVSGWSHTFLYFIANVCTIPSIFFSFSFYKKQKAYSKTCYTL